MRALIVASAAALTLGLTAPASAAPAPIQCGSVITASVKLKADLICSGDALVIGADNVTLDLGGHRVDAGGNDTAITVTDRRNVQIRNGVVEGDRAVHAVRAPGLMVRALRDRKWATRTFIIESSPGATVRDSTFSGFTGLTVTDSPRLRVLDNVIRPGETALDVRGTSDSLVQGNTMVSTNSIGVQFYGDRNVIRGNHLSYSTGGMLVVGDDVKVQRNTLPRGTGGLLTVKGSRAVVEANVATKADAGVQVIGAQARVVGNTVSDIAADGLIVDSAGAVVRDNIAYSNAGYGISSTHPVTAGNNVAFDNHRDKPQCLNVRCSLMPR